MGQAIAEMKYKSNVWAIAYTYKDINGKIYKGILGIYAFTWNQKIPKCCEGFRIATWETRRQAREALKEAKSGMYVPFPNSRVVKLLINYNVTK